MAISDTEDWNPPWSSLARQLHNLLCDIGAASDPPWQGTAQELAAQRYECIFLPMLAAHLSTTGLVTLSDEARTRIEALVRAARTRLQKLHYRTKADPEYTSKRTTDFPLDRKLFLAPFTALGTTQNALEYIPDRVCPIPPLDVALCWAAHRLSRSAYDRDCIALFGTRLPALNRNGLMYVSIKYASVPANAVARLQWECFARAARAQQLLMSRTIPKSFRTFLPRYLWPRYRNDNGLVIGFDVLYRDECREYAPISGST